VSADVYLYDATSVALGAALRCSNETAVGEPKPDVSVAGCSVGEPAEVPDSVSIIGGAPDGEPQPMHYFNARGSSGCT